MKNIRILMSLAMLVLAACYANGVTARAAEDEEAASAAEAEKKVPPGETAYEQGRRLFFLGNYEEAIEQFRAAAAADATKTVYKLYLAKALKNANKPEEAEKIFLEILKENPEHTEAGMALAEIYEKAQRWKELIAVLEPVLEFKHDYAVYHMLARAYYSLPDLKKARMNYEKAVEQNPRSASDHYELGNIYLGENRFALAAEAYEKCLALGRDTGILHYKLATAYSNLRNYLGAVTQRVIKGGMPGTISDEAYIIDSVSGVEDTFYVAPPKSAIFQVSRAIETGIDVPDILFLRANIWLAAGRFEKARALYAELEGKIGKNEQALLYHQYAEAAFGLGRYEEFLKHTGRAIELQPETYGSVLVNAYLRVASRKSQAGDLSGHIEYLGKAIAEKPDVASYHLMIAYTYRDIKNFPQAVAHWKIVLEIEPDRPDRIELLNLISRYATDK